MLHKRFFSIGLLAVVLITGCATNPSSTTSTCVDHSSSLPVDASLQGQSNQFSGDLFDCKMTARLKTIGTDALIGAGIGAGIGAVIGHFTGLGAGKGAAIGTGIGGLGGAGYGYLEANRNESAEEVNVAKQALAVLQQENQNLANYIAQADRAVVADNKRFKEIQQKLKKRKIKRAKAMQEVEKMNEDRSVLQATLTRLKKRKENATKALPKNNPNLTAEMEKYQNQINTLEKIVAQIPERNLSAAG